MADRFDTLICLSGAVTTTALIFLLLGGGAPVDDGRRVASLDKGLQRQITYQARTAFLEKTFEPVMTLHAKGKHQHALLKLDEIRREYPAEAHGYILKGRILKGLGALEEAVKSYVEGVRLNGDYVDEKSPLSASTEIRQIAEEGKTVLGRKLKENPDNPTLAAVLRNVYYLESRLAGGCE